MSGVDDEAKGHEAPAEPLSDVVKLMQRWVDGGGEVEVVKAAIVEWLGAHVDKWKRARTFRKGDAVMGCSVWGYLRHDTVEGMSRDGDKVKCGGVEDHLTTKSTLPVLVLDVSKSQAHLRLAQLHDDAALFVIWSVLAIHCTFIQSCAYAVWLPTLLFTLTCTVWTPVCSQKHEGGIGSDWLFHQAEACFILR